MTQEQLETIVQPFIDSLPENGWEKRPFGLRFSKNGYKLMLTTSLAPSEGHEDLDITLDKEDSKRIIRAAGEYLYDLIKTRGNDFMIDYFEEQVAKSN